MRDFFSIKPAAHETANVRNAITKMLSINEKLTRLASNAREAVKNDVRSINEGRRAVSAYAENI